MLFARGPAAVIPGVPFPAGGRVGRALMIASVLLVLIVELVNWR